MVRQQTRQRPLLSAKTSRSLAILAAAEGRSPSVLMQRLISTYTSAQSAAAIEDRVNRALVELTEEVMAMRNELLMVALGFRHLMIYAAVLPPPGDDAQALGEERFQNFLDDAAETIAAARATAAPCHDGTGGAAGDGRSLTAIPARSR